MNSINLENTLQAQSQGRTLAQHAQLSPDALRVLYAKTVGFFEAGQFEEAMPLAYQLIGLDNQNADYWALAGNIFHRLGHFKEAMNLWMSSLALQARYGTACTIIRTAIALKDKETAAEALLIASKLKQTPEQEREFDALIDAWYAIA